jgi:DNA-binding transcriptional regulator WhiA
MKNNNSKKIDNKRNDNKRNLVAQASRLCMLALQNPELSIEEIEDILEAQAEIAAGMLIEYSFEDL